MGISATGHYVPPLMIFKRKRMKPELLDHTPVGTIGACSENGWINTEIFMDYIKHFVTYTRCSKGHKILLILDGHNSHTKNLELIDYARENGLYLVSLPPHTSHKLQPLDRSYFKSLKSAFNAICTKWMRDHSGRRITVLQLGQLFNEAYNKSATMENAVSGFKTAGIYPFNPQIIPAEQFIDNMVESDEEVPILVGDVANNEVSLVRDVVARPAEYSIDLLVETTPFDQVVSTEVDVSFEEILSIPKLPPQKTKGEKSEIITGSPYKRRLVEAVESAQHKEAKQKANKENKLSKKTSGKKRVKKANKKTIDIPRTNDEDCECFVCGMQWSESKKGEIWVKLGVGYTGQKNKIPQTKIILMSFGITKTNSKKFLKKS